MQSLKHTFSLSIQNSGFTQNFWDLTMQFKEHLRFLNKHIFCHFGWPFVLSFAQVHPPCIYIKTSSKTQEHGTRFYVPELLVLEEVRSVVLLFMCFSFETLLSCSYFKAMTHLFCVCSCFCVFLPYLMCVCVSLICVLCVTCSHFLMVILNIVSS